MDEGIVPVRLFPAMFRYLFSVQQSSNNFEKINKSKDTYCRAISTSATATVVALGVESQQQQQQRLTRIRWTNHSITTNDNVHGDNASTAPTSVP